MWEVFRKPLKRAIGWRRFEVLNLEGVKGLVGREKKVRESSPQNLETRANQD